MRMEMSLWNTSANEIKLKKTERNIIKIRGIVHSQTQPCRAYPLIHMQVINDEQTMLFTFNC